MSYDEYSYTLLSFLFCFFPFELRSLPVPCMAHAGHLAHSLFSAYILNEK